MRRVSAPPSFGKVVQSLRLRLLASQLLLLTLCLFGCNFAAADPSERAQARMALSSAYLQAGMYPLAMLEADKALAADPELPEAMTLKAIIFLKQGRFDMADRYFQMSSLVAPLNPILSHNWGVSECQQGRFESAFVKFNNAVQFSEGLSRDKSLWLWGDCLIQTEEWAGAHAKMSEALRRQPSFISDGLTLARLKIKLGLDSEAEKILDEVNDSPSVSAQSLWLSVQLAQRQNQDKKKNHWGKMLGLLYSNSAQWRAYQEGAPHD